MGRGDDIGDVGRLALRARGDKALLAVIAHVGGMLNVCYCLSQTLMFHQMDAKEMARIGVHAVERETMEALAKCFSKVIYDHTFDYWPAFMQPSKSGHGFSDYDNIMGKWLGEGKPLNREECMVVAYDSHKWLDGYVDRLMRTKTWMRTLTTDAADALLGTETVDAIGGTCSQCFSATEQSWWRFAQKRELAFLSQQGHEIAGVVENYRADLTKPTILICSPIGRPHLTVFLKEAPTYGKCNLVLSRAYYFKDNVMRVPQGLMYVSHEEFARICPDATISNRNEKGVMVAVKFATVRKTGDWCSSYFNFSSSAASGQSFFNAFPRSSLLSARTRRADRTAFFAVVDPLLVSRIQQRRGAPDLSWHGPVSGRRAMAESLSRSRRRCRDTAPHYSRPRKMARSAQPNILARDFQAVSSVGWPRRAVVCFARREWRFG